jgi:hypothetical protein
MAADNFKPPLEKEGFVNRGRWLGPYLRGKGEVHEKFD